MKDDDSIPETRAELHQWVRHRLHLTASQEVSLLEAIDHLFMHQERLWQQSKDDAIHAVSAGFTERLNRMRDELSSRDTKVSNIANYFEGLVADLTDRVHLDPKTRLMNSRRFVEQLETYLALEQRGRWCAVGLVDITAFKWYNDAFGHALGDRIIERVARLLREQVRANDLMANESLAQVGNELHARLGGDEFCFLIPDLDHAEDAWIVAERFREAVERFDWGSEDDRLRDRPVRVDVGMVCLLMGAVGDRRHIARQLAHDLLSGADRLMYEAKHERAHHVARLRMRIEGDALVELPRSDLADPPPPRS